MNPHDTKMTLLDLLYRTFDAYVEDRYRVACRKGCNLCCTQHVTLTTAEAYRVYDHLKKLNITVDLTADEYSFRPRHTINDIAHACLNRREPPEEAPGPVLKQCPFLEGGLCIVYENRPFICRAFLSMQSCQPDGQAELCSGLASIIGACQQIIEHLDVGGYFGNFLELLAILADGNNADSYVQGKFIYTAALPANRPLPGFLVPPEDFEDVNAFLSGLFEKHVDGRTYHQVLNRFYPLPVEALR